jgi:tellurite resistance protein TerA
LSRNRISSDSLIEADRWRAEPSRHGKVLGAAGKIQPGFENLAGSDVVIEPGREGFGKIVIGAEWDNIHGFSQGFLSPLLGRVTTRKIDVDLGCLYELNDGTRGALQAADHIFGSYDRPPYLKLTGSNDKGNRFDQGEFIWINGAKWPEIKRLLVYVCVNGMIPDWSHIRPRVAVDVPGQKRLETVPSLRDSRLPVCAVMGLVNERNGIKATRYMEYFYGRDSMDRAFGFGVSW